MEITSIKSELLLIADFYKNKNDFIKYNNLIDPYLFFSESNTRTLYRLISLYYEGYEEFKDVDFRIFLQTDQEYTSSYLKAGGIEAVEELITMESNSLKQNFEVVRKYALLREYSSKGFDVSKIMKHESFPQLTAKKIHDLVRALCDGIKVRVDGDIDDNITITEKAREFMKGFLIEPEIGVSFGSQGLDDCFRGFRLGQYYVEGMSSNTGKTRRLVALAVHIAFVENQKCLIMSNEMDEKDIKSCVLISLLNHPKFQKMALANNISIKENDFRLGLYKDGNGEYIYREEDEGDDDFVNRVMRDSGQFREAYKMLEWVESQLNIKYKYMNRYSDSDIEMQIRRESFGNNCTHFFYDTLKNYKSSDWGDLQLTATRMGELAKELQVGIMNNLQLTDDSLETNVFDMDSRNIANCKGIYRVVDSFTMGRKIPVEEYSNYHYVTRKGEKKPLNIKFNYYGFKIAKARSAGSHISKDSVILYKVDLNRNIWQDIGVLCRGDI